MDSPLTIVLPVHNAERQLKSMVEAILELTTHSAREVCVAIVDDGSTDDTFETACALACTYPQIAVLRQPFQRGIGPALDRVRRALGAKLALVHDGCSPLDLGELDRQMKAASLTSRGDQQEQARGSRRFASLVALHSQMAQAHRRIGSFRWLSLEGPSTPRRSSRAMLASEETVPAALSPSSHS